MRRLGFPGLDPVGPRPSSRTHFLNPNVFMDQKRFILAAALSLGVILVWQKFFAPKPPPPPDAKQKKSAKKTPGDSEKDTPDASNSPTSGSEKVPTAGSSAGAADESGSGKRDAGTNAASATGQEKTGQTGQADAGSADTSDGGSGGALSDREADAWGTCLTVVTRKFSSSKTELVLQPQPNEVNCSEGSCRVASQVDKRDSDESIPFHCETKNGEVVAFSKGDEASAKAEEDSGGDTGMKAAEPARDIPVETHVMESDHVRVKLTNAGTGRITQIKLIDPPQYQKRGDLLGEFPDNSKHYPFGIQFSKGSIPVPADATFEFVEEGDASVSEDGGETWEKLTYRYEDPKGRFRIDKIFEWSDKNRFVLDMDIEVHNDLEDSKISDSLLLDIFGYKDPDEETSWLNFRPNEIEGVCRMAEEAKRSSISSMDGPLSYDKSQPIWGAIDDRYFITAAVPEEGAKSCGIERVEEGYLRTRLQYEAFSVLPGEKKKLAHELYLGPKDIDVLHEVGHKLGSSVNYGLFAFIARPLRWGLNFLQGYVGNWGLAIILLTVVIKLLTWPINMKAYRSMEGMKEIQPELEEIRDKYEDDQQRMTEETMKLFRENDVSPMGGCLPMLLQMPILYGLYVMIYSSVELYQAEFIFWYTNLAAPDPYYVLPIVMGIVMFIQQGMMTSAGGNMQAKIMTKVMPFMFTGFMLFLPSGLVLYYSVNLIIGLGQQFYIRGIDVPYTDIEWQPGES